MYVRLSLCDERGIHDFEIFDAIASSETEQLVQHMCFRRVVRDDDLPATTMRNVMVGTELIQQPTSFHAQTSF
jgi:hypothetical protein